MSVKHLFISFFRKKTDSLFFFSTDMNGQTVFEKYLKAFLKGKKI